MNLRECADTLNGYGADLARKLIESPGDMSEADADALFRTLVLHDDVGEASPELTPLGRLVASVGAAEMLQGGGS